MVCNIKVQKKRHKEVKDADFEKSTKIFLQKLQFISSIK